MKPLRTKVAAVCIAIAFGVTACGGADAVPDTQAAAEPTQEVTQDVAGIRLISAAEGADIQANPPEDLVILDVRTPEEFAAGHVEGAILVDFFDDDFAEQLAELDPDVPYLLYCNSGNRSGQTIEILQELGFTDVADVDGGIQAWASEGLPTVIP